MSTTNSSERNGDYSQFLKTYTPIFRDKRIEREEVLPQFGGLRNYTDRDTLDLLPLLEVTDEDDFVHVESYRVGGSPVLVDVPQYLAQTEEENDLTGEVNELLRGRSSPVEVLEANAKYVDVPVVSGELEAVFDYRTVADRYERIAGQFEDVAVRIFVPSDELNQQQRRDLNALSETLDESDYVLIDCLEPDRLNPETTGRANVAWITETFAENQRILLDAFSYYRGENYNFGPEVAVENGLHGFGDFALNRRFPPAEEIPMGRHDTRTIRLYDEDDRSVREFQGDGFTGDNSAREAMRESDDWDPGHCEFCRQAEREDNEGFGFWKRVRTGDYIESVIRGDQ